jgi:hypothetical protein
MFTEYFPYIALSMRPDLPRPNVPRLTPPNCDGLSSPRITYRDPVKPVRKRRNEHSQKNLRKRRLSKTSRRKNRL